METKDKVLNGQGLAEYTAKVKEAIAGNVVANPTIPSGTVPTAMQNIQIDENYFSMPQEKHWYRHTVNIEKTQQYNIVTNLYYQASLVFTIINNSSTPIDTSNIRNTLAAIDTGCHTTHVASGIIVCVNNGAIESQYLVTGLYAGYYSAGPQTAIGVSTVQIKGSNETIAWKTDQAIPINSITAMSDFVEAL